ncbi:hypothetical protein [Kocuria nitroreducens]|uniref:hypothetical protein n=1 Tax=Kocuria nitroreducens TaxID=3058914 RepID=UPI0036DD3BBC
MPESPAHWVPLAAIPVLLAVGALAVLHWSRYLGAIGRLERVRTSPGATPDPSSAAWLELRSEEHYRRAYRLTWAVAVVLAVGLTAAVLAG